MYVQISMHIPIYMRIFRFLSKEFIIIIFLFIFLVSLVGEPCLCITTMQSGHKVYPYCVLYGLLEGPLVSGLIAVRQLLIVVLLFSMHAFPWHTLIVMYRYLYCLFSSLHLAQVSKFLFLYV